MKNGYNKTIISCFVGYIVQAIINNFIPLLFLTFQDSYGISLGKITLLAASQSPVLINISISAITFC